MGNFDTKDFLMSSFGLSTAMNGAAVIVKGVVVVVVAVFLKVSLGLRAEAAATEGGVEGVTGVMVLVTGLSIGIKAVEAVLDPMPVSVPAGLSKALMASRTPDLGLGPPSKALIASWTDFFLNSATPLDSGTLFVSTTLVFSVDD